MKAEFITAVVAFSAGFAVSTIFFGRIKSFVAREIADMKVELQAEIQKLSKLL